MLSKSVYRALTLVVVAFFSLCQSALPAPLRLSMLLEHESFLMWYAKEQYWDQQLGLNLELSIHNTSGADLIRRQQDDPKGWDVTTVGVVPSVLYSKSMPLLAIALANNESRATEIFVRADSDIMKTQGFNSAYPTVYGSPDSVRGKTFLVRENTASFYTLMTWIKLFGLDFGDVKYLDVMPSDAVQSMFTGNADGLVLWSPYSYDALRLGYSHVANAEDVHAFVPILLLTNPDYARDHAEELGKLLAIYLKACAVQKNNPEDLIPAYQEFLKIYTGRNFDREFCKFDLQRHRVFSLEEQLEYFKKTDGKNKLTLAKDQILTIFHEISSSLHFKETYEPENYPITSTDKYLRQAAQYLAP